MMARQRPQQEEEEEEKTCSSSSSSSVNDWSSVCYTAEDSETFGFSPSLPPSPSDLSSGERVEALPLPLPRLPTLSSDGHRPSTEPSERKSSLSSLPNHSLPPLLSSSSSLSCSSSSPSQVTSSLLSSEDRRTTATEDFHSHADKENSRDVLGNATGREEEQEREGGGATEEESKSFSATKTRQATDRDRHSREEEEEERSTTMMVVPWGKDERDGEMAASIVESPLPLSLPSPSQTIEAVAIEAPGRKRLMIERVVLENFKSYGKQKVIGPFHKVSLSLPLCLRYLSLCISILDRYTRMTTQIFVFLDLLSSSFLSLDLFPSLSSSSSPFLSPSLLLLRLLLSSFFLSFLLTSFNFPLTLSIFLSHSPL